MKFRWFFSWPHYSCAFMRYTHDSTADCNISTTHNAGQIALLEKAYTIAWLLYSSREFFKGTKSPSNAFWTITYQKEKITIEIVSIQRTITFGAISFSSNHFFTSSTCKNRLCKISHEVHTYSLLMHGDKLWKDWNNASTTWYIGIKKLLIKRETYVIGNIIDWVYLYIPHQRMS